MTVRTCGIFLEEMRDEVVKAGGCGQVGCYSFNPHNLVHISSLRAVKPK